MDVPCKYPAQRIMWGCHLVPKSDKNDSSLRKEYKGSHMLSVVFRTTLMVIRIFYIDSSDLLPRIVAGPGAVIKLMVRTL